MASYEVICHHIMSSYDDVILDVIRMSLYDVIRTSAYDVIICHITSLSGFDDDDVIIWYDMSYDVIIWCQHQMTSDYVISWQLSTVINSCCWYLTLVDTGQQLVTHIDSCSHLLTVVDDSQQLQVSLTVEKCQQWLSTTADDCKQLSTIVDDNCRWQTDNCWWWWQLKVTDDDDDSWQHQMRMTVDDDRLKEMMTDANDRWWWLSSIEDDRWWWQMTTTDKDCCLKTTMTDEDDNHERQDGTEPDRQTDKTERHTQTLCNPQAKISVQRLPYRPSNHGKLYSELFHYLPSGAPRLRCTSHMTLYGVQITWLVTVLTMI